MIGLCRVCATEGKLTLMLCPNCYKNDVYIMQQRALGIDLGPTEHEKLLTVKLAPACIQPKKLEELGSLERLRIARLEAKKTTDVIKKIHFMRSQYEQTTFRQLLTCVRNNEVVDLQKILAETDAYHSYVEAEISLAREKLSQLDKEIKNRKAALK